MTLNPKESSKLVLTLMGVYSFGITSQIGMQLVRQLSPFSVVRWYGEGCGASPEVYSRFSN